MEDFSRDCLRIGCLRAFVHFSLTLRGREELVVTVRTQVQLLICVKALQMSDGFRRRLLQATLRLLP
jgi:hypothetical protein